MTRNLMMDSSLVIRPAASVVKINDSQTFVRGPRLLCEKVVASLWQNQKNRDNKMFIKLFCVCNIISILLLWLNDKGH